MNWKIKAGLFFIVVFGLLFRLLRAGCIPSRHRTDPRNTSQDLVSCEAQFLCGDSRALPWSLSVGLETAHMPCELEKLYAQCLAAVRAAEARATDSGATWEFALLVTPEVLAGVAQASKIQVRKFGEI